jgi:hypothetical protein
LRGDLAEYLVEKGAVLMASAGSLPFY